MRRLLAAILCSLCACTSAVAGGDPIPNTDTQSATPQDGVLDASRPPGDPTGPDLPDASVEDTPAAVDVTRAGEVLDSDGEAGETSNSDPFADIQSHFVLTSPGAGNGGVLMDATFQGYEPTVFGAQVYGKTLKIWGSQEPTRAEVLVRLDQVALPGAVTPGEPGGAAWIVVLVEGTDAYVSQLQTGEIVIDSCPDTPGMMISGQLNGLVLFTTSGVGYQTMGVGGSFEVVLGEVLGEVPCSP